MAKIYRITDRIPIKIDTLSISISPLTFDQKTELQTIMMAAAKDPMHAMTGARLAVKYAVKSVSGIEDLDGNDYQVDLEDDGTLTTESVDALFNMEETAKIIAVCSQLIAGVPKVIMDPTTKAPMVGVSIDMPKKSKARKQKQSGSLG